MTPKQKERVLNKIKKIRAEISAEKRMYGGYIDGRGLRYIPFELYLKICDYKGGLTYLKWFSKNFSDDSMSEIALMAAIIYFKNDKLKDAEKQIVEICSFEPYVIDIFMDRPITSTQKIYYDIDKLKEFFSTLKKHDDLTDFQAWLVQTEATEEFQEKVSNES